jgi:hypothetical protein
MANLQHVAIIKVGSRCIGSRGGSSSRRGSGSSSGANSSSSSKIKPYAFAITLMKEGGCDKCDDAMM